MSLSSNVRERLNSRTFNTGPYTPAPGTNLPHELLSIVLSTENNNGSQATRKINGEPQPVAYVKLTFRELENATGSKIHEWGPPAFWIYLGSENYDPESSDQAIASIGKQIQFQESSLMRWVYFFAGADKDESPLDDWIDYLENELIPNVNNRDEGSHPTFTLDVSVRTSGKYTNTYINPNTLLTP